MRCGGADSPSRRSVRGPRLESRSGLWNERQTPRAGGRLLEREAASDDEDPKALACYGVYLPTNEKESSSNEDASEETESDMLLRFVEGRPVSEVTTTFLEGVCSGGGLRATRRERHRRLGPRVGPGLLAHQSQRPKRDPPAQRAGEGRGRGAHSCLPAALEKPVAQSDRAEVAPRQACHLPAGGNADSRGCDRTRSCVFRLQKSRAHFQADRLKLH